MVLLQAGRTVAHACYNLRLRRQWSLSRQPEDSDVSSRTLTQYSDKSTVSCLIKARIVGSRVPKRVANQSLLPHLVALVVRMMAHRSVFP